MIFALVWQWLMAFAGYKDNIEQLWIAAVFEASFFF